MRQVGVFILSFLLILLLNRNLYAYNFKQLVVLSFGKDSTPSDIILNNDSTFSIYDSFDGSFTTYSGNKVLKKLILPTLKHGTCLVKFDNLFFFCNNEKHRLDVLDRNFKLIRSFNYIPSPNYRFDPTDVLKFGDNLIVVDNDNHRVLRFSFTSGKLLSFVGDYGQDKLKFWYPYSISYDFISKTILVTEVLNTRIQRLTPDLRFYDFVGGWGIAGGQFFRPTASIVTPKGNIIVGDGYNGVIQLLNNEGKFIFSPKKDYGSIIRIRSNSNKIGILDGWNKKVYIEELMEER